MLPRKCGFKKAWALVSVDPRKHLRLRRRHGESLLENLRAVLLDEGQGFLQRPAPEGAASQDPSAAFCAECAICYSYRLLPPEEEDTAASREEAAGIAAAEGGAIPDHACDNEHCARSATPAALRSRRLARAYSS